MGRFTLRQTANQVRRWSEVLAEKTGFDYDLCGFCAIASAKLFLALKAQGRKPKLKVSERKGMYSHVFVVCEDNPGDGKWKLLDITSSQFGGPKVVCRAFIESRPGKHYWKAKRTYSRLKEFKMTGWPKEQKYAQYSPWFDWTPDQLAQENLPVF